MDAREGESTATTHGTPVRAAAPGPAELLRATLEKIVFFEWRVSELAAALASAESRAAAAEQERARVFEEAAQSRHEAQTARHQLAELESERARLASLLSRPAHGPIDGVALEAERQRAAELTAELAEARALVQRQQQERSRWLQEMIDQARQGDEAPAALAQFISELRADVITLRERQRQSDALLLQHGLAAPAPIEEQPRPPPPRAEGAVETARRFWAEGRLELPAQHDAFQASGLPRDVQLPRPRAQGPVTTDLLPGLAALRIHHHPHPELPASAPLAAVKQAPQAPRAAYALHAPAASRPMPAAQRALAEQCLRGLVARDPLRRAQAARHLAALPVPAAAPALAAALGRESDPRTRAALARALAACGGEQASALVLRLLVPEEPALVRLAALDSLAIPGATLCRAALEAGAADVSPTVRRRTASLAQAAGGAEELVARLFADQDASVRAAAGGGEELPEAPLAAEELSVVSVVSQGSAVSAGAASTPPNGLHGAHAAPPAPAAPALTPAAALTEPAPPPAHSSELERDALYAVRAAIFGLTEAELVSAVNLDGARGSELVQDLLARGLLARRGKRLVAAVAAVSGGDRAEERS